MSTSIVTRWEDWRDLRGGNPRHRHAVDDWLQSHPSILYWGDSWFSTPLYPNLARQSAERIDGLRMIIGKPGALAAELMASRQVSRMMGRIKANPFDVLCLSAGGNDALSDRLASVFAPWMKSRKASLSPQDAFDRVLDSNLFARLADRYRLLLDSVQVEVLKKRPWFRVVGHTYAPLHRIGVAGDLTIGNIGLIAILKDDVGPWLWGPMQRVLSDVDKGAAFSRLLLVDGFRKCVLEAMEQEYSGLFSFADVASVAALADSNHWHDEIHPTAEGFALCTPVLNTALRTALPASKRAAVG